MHRRLARRAEHQDPRHLRCAGQPDGLSPDPGQACDLEGADALLGELDGVGALLADRAYDASERVLDRLAAAGIEAVIPDTPRRVLKHGFDRHLYKACHPIENFFVELKQYRAIATRYDKTAVIFLGAVHLAAAAVWLA